MAEDAREEAFWIKAVEGVGIGVAKGGVSYFDTDFTSFRGIDNDISDL